MYREREHKIIQKQVHHHLFSDSLKYEYVATQLEAFVGDHSDCELSISRSNDEGGERYNLVISGWRDCTQEELRAKERAEQTRVEQNVQRDKMIFARIKKEHPEWLTE